jgi:phosphatidate phosphatase APP1
MNKIGKVARMLGEVEAIVDWARDRVRGERGQGPFRIVPYRGHGTPRLLHLRGRVLEGEPIPSARLEDSTWRNLLHTLRRMESDEVPAARVRARLGSRAWEALADDEGYFDLRLEPGEPLPDGGVWHPVELELLDPLNEDGSGARATGRVLVPPRGARFGVVSDIDDTVVRTDVANLLSMARLVLLTNAHTRLPFEGVAAFYRALHAGPGGGHLNPVFYVSSSPWNFYDLLDEVLAVHSIPAGPLFLKDYGLSRDVLLASGHHEHKLGAIEEILQTHHNLPFVLIGDSGQEDPEIYRTVVQRFPGRILAVYIRDVASGERDRRVREIAAEVAGEGVEMVLIRDTVAAARHAVGRGLIDADALAEIQGQQAADEAAPDPLERVLEGGGE